MQRHLVEKELGAERLAQRRHDARGARPLRADGVGVQRQLGKCGEPTALEAGEAFDGAQPVAAHVKQLERRERGASALRLLRLHLRLRGLLVLVRPSRQHRLGDRRRWGRRRLGLGHHQPVERVQPVMREVELL